MPCKKKYIFVGAAILVLLAGILAVLAVIGGTSSDEKRPQFDISKQGSRRLEFTSNGDGTCTVTGIGQCTEKEIVIPATSPEGDNVTAIGMSAFYDCRDLIGITIPEGLTTIESYAFSGSGLTEIVIPASVTTIGEGAFGACASLEKLTVSPENRIYHSDGNCLIETESRTLIAGCKNSVIPADGSVTVIGMQAFFNCEGVTSIVIPEGVQVIGRYAFEYCSDLADLVISNTVINIEDAAFYDCSSLTAITIPANVAVIASDAFIGCTGLESITVSENNCTYHSQGNCLMETASGILVLGCRNSAIPTDGSVTAIGSQAFFHCEGLTEVQIPDGVHTIEAFAFTGCSSLTDVSIPDSVITIESYAFTGCGLTAIALPASVTAMGSEVFVGCGDLQSITVSPDNMVYHSAGNCLIETKSGTLLLGCNNSVIPADGSVTSIGAQAFAGCGELTDITIPASVTQMESGAFYGCTGLQSITVSPDNMVYHSAGNCLIETNSKTLLLGCNNSVIPTDGSVTAIGAQAFAGCKGLISLTIPHSVTAIGYAAFVDCENLGSITVLNPNCEWTIIYDALMFSTRFPAGVTLYGYASSTTQTMAERYGIPFLLIED